MYKNDAKLLNLGIIPQFAAMQEKTGDWYNFSVLK